jgi:hypothetical protein
MKLRSILTAFFVLTISSVFAQMQPFGHLTIFSEDGDKFYLILNGEKINDVAQTNLRVEELTQPYYNAKILFEDSAKQPISKNNLAIADVDGFFKDVTYKIRRDKNNSTKMKMNFFSETEVDPGFLPPSNIKVIHYGQPAPPPPAATVTHTTTTTTTSGGINAGVSVGGIGVNVTINDPDMAVTHSQTTTTTTSSSSSSSYGGEEHHEEHQGCANGHCMSQNNFASALQTVKNQSFDDTRLKTAKQVVSANCLTATQIAEICQIFGFEQTKLDFAKFAYNNCTEPNNYFKVNNVFGFSTSVDELTEYISSR